MLTASSGLLMAGVAAGAVFSPWLNWAAWSLRCSPQTPGLRAVLVWLQVVGFLQSGVMFATFAVGWGAESTRRMFDMPALFVSLVHMFHGLVVAWMVRSCC